MIEKFIHLTTKKNKKDWKKVTYPPSLSFKFFSFIPLKILIIIIIITLEVIITVNISDKIHSNIGQLLITIILFWVIYKTIKYYRRFQKNKQEGIRYK